MQATEVRTEGSLEAELSGLDNLELAADPGPSRLRRFWSALWPKLAALALVLAVWQAVVSTHWKPEFVLPGPNKVFPELWRRMAHPTTLHPSVFEAAAITMYRALKGYLYALVLGVFVGSLMAQAKVLRAAFGSLITGLQTMPSIAWFPLAILLFKFSENAIMFVVVIGSAPSIANGLLTGIDNIPPLLLRAGRVLGASRLETFRFIILPAALPSFIGGMKQGWAFSWRSLLAGELLVQIAGRPSIGRDLDIARNNSDAAGVLAMMIVIVVIGIAIDALFFGVAERAIRRRWGLDGG
jgi:NitT/TauT family transport system permease protein